MAQGKGDDPANSAEAASEEALGKHLVQDTTRHLATGGPSDETVDLDPRTEVMEHEPRVSTPAPPPGASLEQRIGPYLLLEKLGEGGMGTVYLARQEQPVKRDVAVKVLKPGLGSTEVLNRFAAERQALALMSHRGIAKMFDAGITGDGLSYFVMEYVDGEPITDYCDRRELKINDRIPLFLQVCRAIQHAHQKGIIRRDIKPSNILVSEAEGRPEVKVIDFGIAKAVGFTLTEETVHTQLGYVVGTLEYMSPEQANFGKVDVDTRSDVYSLGVLLYKLMTGVVPFSASKDEVPAVFLIQRSILSQEPPKPSSRLTQQTKGIGAIAKFRSASVPELARTVRGDLDWILLKALEKEPSRRYASPHELQEELERYLAHEVVLAGPPSTLYRIKKFTTRHRTTAILAALFVVAFAVAFIGVTFGLIETRKANAKAQSTLALLEELLVSVDPEQEGPDLEVVALLAGFEDRLRQVDDPEIRMRLQQTFATTYSALGKSDKAMELLRAILDGLDAGDGNAGGEERRIHVLNRISRIQLEELPSAEIRDQIREQLDASMRVLGAEHSETRIARWNLASIQNKLGENLKALPLAEELLASNRRQRGTSHRETLRTQMLLGRILKELGRLEEALTVDTEVLVTSLRAFGDHHPRTITARGNVATGLVESGKLTGALPLFEESLAQAKQVFGPHHPKTLWLLGHVAEIQTDLGHYAKALALQEELLSHQAKSFSPDHLEVLWTRDSLARTYRRMGRHGEAFDISTEVFEVLRRDLGDEHPETLASMEVQARTLAAMGRFAEALEVEKQVLDARSRVLGREHRETRDALALTATLEVAIHGEKPLPRFDEILPDLDGDLARLIALDTLLAALRSSGQERLAGPYHEQLRRLLEATMGLDNPRGEEFRAHYEAFERTRPI